MSFEKLLENASRRLQEVYKLALEMATSNHPEITKDNREIRITCLAYMKMIIDIMRMEKEVGW